MKRLFFSFVVLFAIHSPFAANADTKLGSVIAVERQLNNIYDGCLQNLTGDWQGKHFFFMCGIRYLNPSSELPVTRGGVIRFVDGDCSVDGELANGKLLLTFGHSKAATDLDTAKSCLRRGLTNRDSMKVVVYTIE